MVDESNRLDIVSPTLQQQELYKEAIKKSYIDIKKQKLNTNLLSLSNLNIQVPSPDLIPGIKESTIDISKSIKVVFTDTFQGYGPIRTQRMKWDSIDNQLIITVYNERVETDPDLTSVLMKTFELIKADGDTEEVGIGSSFENYFRPVAEANIMLLSAQNE